MVRRRTQITPLLGRKGRKDSIFVRLKGSSSAPFTRRDPLYLVSVTVRRVLRDPSPVRPERPQIGSAGFCPLEESLLRPTTPLGRDPFPSFGRWARDREPAAGEGVRRTGVREAVVVPLPRESGPGRLRSAVGE